MIQEKKPVNILDMVDDKQVKLNELKRKTCAYIKEQYSAGKSKEDILENINKIDLPLSLHLAITSKFSEVCKYGRILTKREREVYRS